MRVAQLVPFSVRRSAMSRPALDNDVSEQTEG